MVSNVVPKVVDTWGLVSARVGACLSPDVTAMAGCCLLLILANAKNFE